MNLDDVRWWDATYCTDDETVPHVLKGASRAAVRSWARRIERESGLGSHIFDSRNVFTFESGRQWGTGYRWLSMKPHEFAPGEKQPVEAWSQATQQTYPTWEDLIAAESNGWLLTVLISNGKKTWPYTVGPFETRREANNARARMRNKFRRESYMYPDHTYKFFVRPAWKDLRS